MSLRTEEEVRKIEGVKSTGIKIYLRNLRNGKLEKFMTLSIIRDFKWPTPSYTKTKNKK